MAEIDLGIYRNFLAAPKSIQDYDNEAMQANHNALAYKSQQAQYNALQRQQAEDQQYRDAAKAFGTDTQANYNALMGRGLVKQALDYQKAALEGQKTRSEIDKNKSVSGKDDASAMVSKVGLLKSLSTSVIANPSPESALNAIDQWEKLTGLDGSADRAAIAQMTSPDQIKSWAYGHAVDADKLLPQFQTRNLGGTTETLSIDPVTGMTKTVNSARNSVSPGDQLQAETTRRGQNMVDARAREATQATMSKPFEVTGADGQPVLVQQDKQGNIRPVQGYSPKTAADKPLPEAAQKQVMGARNLQDAVGGYLSKLENWSNSKMLTPDQRAEMGNAYNNMMLQAKEAYNLGVLNGPDYDILQSVVKDPTKLTSILTSNEALSGQAKSLRNIAANIEKTALESHGKKYTPRNPSQTTTPKVGSIEDGHRFKGGDPSNPSNWEKVK